MPLPKSLPEPDDYGHYWLGVRPSGPVILRAGRTKGVAPANAEGWLASLGSLVVGGGVLFEGDSIQYFKTPQLALEALRDALP